MKLRFLYLLLAATALSIVATAGEAASTNNSTVCEKTAARMLRSCTAEVEEEYNATIASCINFSDAVERNDCHMTAVKARQEDSKGCGDQEEARREVCELLNEDRYDPDPLTDDTIDFIATPDDRNPYFSLQPGHTYVVRAGENFEETIVVHVTDEVRKIRGINCRIVVDIVLLSEDDEYVAVEVTDDLYAQSSIGDVYYCGEIARNYDDEGVLRDLDGSFEAGLDYAKAGILIKSVPKIGEAHRQEWKIGEAEDVIAYVGLSEAPGEEEGGENPVHIDFNCAMNGGCLKTEEFIPPEPDAGEFKYFLSGIGFVLGVALEDGEPSGERDELVCYGDSLAILDDASCGIGDDEQIEQLKAELCRLSPDAFCADE